MKIKIGTRGSKLALWQAYHIETLLQKGGLETEIIIIETKGDKNLNKPLSEIGSKGLFTEELEEKLLNKEIDIAVHSAKDMQSELPSELEIIAFTEREKPNDVLVSLDENFSLDTTDKEIIVGTSSTRRKATLKKYYPHIKTAEARGNLQTRFKKMEDGNFQAMILAYAGVHRMGYDDKIVHVFPLETFTPAVGQGSIAIETAKNLDPSKREKLYSLLNHKETEYCLRTERAFLKTLQGGCSIPLFALANFKDGAISINGGIISLDGQESISTAMSDKSENAEQLGIKLATTLIEKGAGPILEKIKSIKNQ